MASAALGPAGREYHFEDSEFTFPLTTTGITTTTPAGLLAAVGKALSIDTSVTPAFGSPPTLKLAADNDEIFARLETIEDRTQDGLGFVCNAALRFVGVLPLKVSETPAPGAQLIGAGTGTVKVRAALTVTDTGTSGTPVTWTLGKAKPCTAYSYDGTANLVTCAFGV